jgi:hypothetical protein
MRKKSDMVVGSTSGVGVSNNPITKRARAVTSTQPARGGPSSRSKPVNTNGVSHSTSSDLVGPSSHLDDMVDDTVSMTDSRDRSTSPVESDLLRYLTAHIMPPCTMDCNSIGSSGVDVTSFVIGREEYLEGVVRLVQSDCPEVTNNMKSFIDAMKDAFMNVNMPHAREFVTALNI